jgi:hypothetical protein
MKLSRNQIQLFIREVALGSLIIAPYFFVNALTH